jgi:hypothetical protein
MFQNCVKLQVITRQVSIRGYAENPLLGLWADRITWEPLEFRQYVTTCRKYRQGFYNLN